MNWQRVTRQNPCTVCGKPDWCTRGISVACCMRVASDRPCGNGGYLHRLEQSRPFIPRQPEPPAPTINCTRLLENWAESTPLDWIQEFASDLGVSIESLQSLGCVWADDRHAWAFPMRDGYGEIVGIRLRDRQGHKWAVTGSRQGIFVPKMCPLAVALIVEGPTDTAAALTMGCFAIGRPSCCGGNIQAITALRQHRVKRAIVISDNDGPGIQGAERFSSELPIPNVIFTPPAKDLREFLRFGGSAVLIESMTNSMVWNRPDYERKT